MKGKKGTYILLGVVCLIWLGIAIEIVTAFSPKDENLALVNTPVNNRNIKKIEKELFSIETVNRDPFLGTLQKKKIVRRPSKILKPKKKLNWPRIKYKGIVSDKNNKSSIFLIEINGAIQLIKRGNTQLEVTLVKGNQSSVTLNYKGEKKEILRSSN